jgi:hypothetical protein
MWKRMTKKQRSGNGRSGVDLRSRWQAGRNLHKEKLSGVDLSSAILPGIY